MLVWEGATSQLCSSITSVPQQHSQAQQKMGRALWKGLETATTGSLCPGKSIACNIAIELKMSICLGLR